MSALAVYRLPYGKFATMIQQTDGEPAELLSCAELNGRQGFVMAPFEITDSHPILLIRPDKVERISVERGMSNEEKKLLSIYQKLSPEQKDTIWTLMEKWEREYEVKEEAEFVFKHLKGKEISYPVVYDLEKIKNEPARTDNLTSEQINDMTLE